MSELHLTFAVDRDPARPAVARLALAGELDLASSLRLQAALDELVEDGVREVVVDLAGVTFIDSTGLSFLLHVRKQLLAVGGVVVVSEVSSAVFRVLRIAGLHRLLLTSEQVEGATRAHGGAAEDAVV